MNEPLNIAKAELDYIPRGSLAQNVLRATYFSLREESLGRRPSIRNDRQAVLDEALAIVRKNWPDFQPEIGPGLLASG